MAKIILSKTRFVNQQILPQVDKLAISRACTRSDVLKDIFYSTFKYRPLKRTPEQIEAMYAIEKSEERECEKNKCMAVVIDTKFQDILLQYHALRCERYDRTVQSVKCQYSGTRIEGGAANAASSAYTITVGNNPMKCRVLIRKPGQVKA